MSDDASDLVSPYSETYKDWVAMVEQAVGDNDNVTEIRYDCLDQSMTLCDVYEAISPCAEGTECQEDGGTASCIQWYDAGAVMVVCGIACDVDTESEEDDSDLGLIIGLSVSIPVVLLAPSPVSASPVPSLDSIFAVMEAQPVSRKGSWTDNM
nr:hypothetical protein BaRGS_001733 [Batillaria attramentaria]